MRTLTLIQSLALGAALCSSAAWAQQAPKDSPSTGSSTLIQPLSPLAGDSVGNPAMALDGAPTQTDVQPGTSAQAQPDTRVLSSAETLGLGSLLGLPRIFDPALFFSEFDETGLSAGRAVLVSSLGGSLAADEHWGRYHLAVSYNGGESMYRPSYGGQPYMSYEGLSISPEILLGRWTLRLRDTVMYSGGIGFGGLFSGGPAQSVQINGLNAIQPAFVSNATIQTGLARQVNNAALLEADYAMSHRTTLTFVGSYGLLNFLGPGYVDSQFIDGRVGYNYALSLANSFSLSYDHNHTSFGGSSNRMQTDLIQIGFGRKITGRLAFQLQAGPELLRFVNFGTSASPQLSWSASSALTYSLRRSGYSLSYAHGVTGGSGVFRGSNNDTVTAMTSRQFTRSWSASVDGGYAINKNPLPAGNFTSRFDDWFAGANLNRQIGRQIGLGLSYGYQRQTSTGGVCPVLSCGLPGSTSFRQFGATLQWHPLAAKAR